LLAAEAGRSADVSIRLHKQIPVGGGLAGGSADAAATLVALNQLWNLGWSIDRLAALGAWLGSDVPFCTISRPSWVRGRGERVEPLADPLPPLWAVLILPGLAVSTRAVYQRLDADRVAGVARPGRKHLLGRLECFNDLEQAALSVSRPLAELFGSLEACGTPRLMVAGSGSTLFVLFDNAGEAEEWTKRIRLEARCAVVIAAVLSDTSNCTSARPECRAAACTCDLLQGESNGHHRSADQAD
jgi:4-diphosphocytidyl-2-C-methyl-D-erythritol kinase